MDQDNSNDSTPPPPPPPPPPADAQLTDSGHIQRALPEVRTVEANKFNKNPADVGNALRGTAAKAALDVYNKEIKDRYAEVQKEFEEWEKDLSPIHDPEFKHFIRAQLSYANMSYITMGTFPGDIRKTEDNQANEELEEQLGQLSPMLRDLPAAQLALEDGANLLGGLENED